MTSLFSLFGVPYPSVGASGSSPENPITIPSSPTTVHRGVPVARYPSVSARALTPFGNSFRTTAHRYVAGIVSSALEKHLLCKLKDKRLRSRYTVGCSGAGTCVQTPLVLKQPGTSQHGMLLVCTGVERNPGPSNEDYALLPDLFRWAVSSLGCPTPYLDAFAARHNALCSRWWSVLNSAFDHSWWGLLPIWANPPFSLLHRVLTYITTKGGNVVLLCPEWGRISRLFRSLARDSVLLPRGPLVRAINGRVLPSPPWRAWVFWIEKPPPAPPIAYLGRLTIATDVGWESKEVGADEKRITDPPGKGRGQALT